MQAGTEPLRKQLSKLTASFPRLSHPRKSGGQRSLARRARRLPITPQSL